MLTLAKTKQIMLDSLSEEQREEWASLEERAAHSDTVKPLSPLEAEWLDCYRRLYT